MAVAAAASMSLFEALSSFSTAVDSSTQSLPDSDRILPPTSNGISLLDTKNEIFLAYLQALALRNLNVIRSLKYGANAEDAQKLSDKITRKLVEHRVYLERGVRPLEQKIKFQVDKVVKAADEEARNEAQRQTRAAVTNGHGKRRPGKEAGSEDSSDEEDSDSDASSEPDPQTAGPRAHAFSLPQARGADEGRRGTLKSSANGVYRPPRISATSMPAADQREPKERRTARSAVLEEYVNNELSNAPLAEPSIGSTIAAGGRSNKDNRQLAKEQERRDYEESNLVRLPKESKKERAKQAGRDKSGRFGGEEWRGLGESVDRIGDVTRKKGKDSALEKSRKRKAVEDRPRDDGIGGAFDMRKRKLMKKMRR